MNIHQITNKKTALLFFDMLNVYFHGIPEEKQQALKPVVDNAVRLMNAARQHDGDDHSGAQTSHHRGSLAVEHSA